MDKAQEMVADRLDPVLALGKVAAVGEPVSAVLLVAVVLAADPA